MNNVVFHKVMIGIFVAVLIASGYGITLGHQQLIEKSEEIANKKAEKEVLDTRVLSYLRDKDFIQNNEDLVDAVNEALPSNKNQAELVAEYKKFAAQYSLEIDTIAFSSTAGASDPNTSQTETVKNIPEARVISANVRFRPTDNLTYENLMKFILRVEENRRIMQITDISLVPSRDDLNRPILSTATLEIEAFIKG